MVPNVSPVCGLVGAQCCCLFLPSFTGMRKRNIKAPTMQSTNGKRGGWKDVPFRKLVLSFCCLNKVLKSTQHIKPTYRCHTSRYLVPHTCGTSKYKKTASSNDTGYYLSIGAYSSTSRGWQRLPINLYFLFASVVGIRHSAVFLVV